jgi:pSer/pThr/pTyr-binding forkhead associated (FHA) protein
MEDNIFLEIEQGAPFKTGDKVPVIKAIVQIGRDTEDHKADVAFDDVRISRNHCEIRYSDGCWTIQDNSTNGTEINGRVLPRGGICRLNPGDAIVLAKGLAELCFCRRTDAGKTRDVTGLKDADSVELTPAENPGLVVDKDRREVIINGRELRPRIGGNEFELLVLLSRNAGKAVTHEEIVEWVWRDLADRETITRQNVATVVLRLRKYLGEYSKNIVNITGYGYRLDQV